MNIAETLRGLRRRWYIVLPGIIVAAGLASWMWVSTPPMYERTATQLLLPGAATLPESTEGAPNPFLYLGGLTTAADVTVGALNAPQIVREATEAHAGSEVSVTRDPSTSGPVVLITATAPSDEAAADIIDTMLQQTVDVLDALQSEQEVTEDAKVTVSTLAVADESELNYRDRALYSVGAGAGAVLLALLLAAAVDGLVRQRGRRRVRAARKERRAGGAAKRRDTATALAGADEVDDPIEDVDKPRTETVDAPRTEKAGVGPDPVASPSAEKSAPKRSTTPGNRAAVADLEVLAEVDVALDRLLLAERAPIGARRQGNP
ncbi:hypothetical protein [Microbacterium sp. JZ31]|uniref:hypothetical protein n=1 Tax=Microbacterium sp. JZ31 TaxID=1906274 RepID=UPI0019334163|nr:hypothetical protein [Microbacterium sp. JZ31]